MMEQPKYWLVDTSVEMLVKRDGGGRSWEDVTPRSDCSSAAATFSACCHVGLELSGGWMEKQIQQTQQNLFHSLRGEAKKIRTALRYKRFRRKEILLGEIMQFILCQSRRPEVGSRHWTAAPRVLGISAPQRRGTTSRLLYWDVREHLLKVSMQQDSDTQSSQLSAHPSTGKCFKGQFASAFFFWKTTVLNCFSFFLFFRTIARNNS